MSYNKTTEKNKWNRRKEYEEKVLRFLNVPEEKILDLRNYDWEDFLRDRRFNDHENVTKDTFFLIQPVYTPKHIDTIDDLLNEIEDEKLLAFLKEQNEELLKILILILDGYTIKEISDYLGITTNAIYKKIKNLKEKFKQLG